jgi:hypothetical protein
MGGGGKAPKPTAEQKAMERAQREQLDKETASSESRLKAMAQKKIGKKSLLGTPIQQAEGPAGPTVTEGYQVTSSGGVRKIPFAGLLRRSAQSAKLGIKTPSSTKGAIK